MPPRVEINNDVIKDFYYNFLIGNLSWIYFQIYIEIYFIFICDLWLSSPPPMVGEEVKDLMLGADIKD